MKRMLLNHGQTLATMTINGTTMIKFNYFDKKFSNFPQSPCALETASTVKAEKIEILAIMVSSAYLLNILYTKKEAAIICLTIRQN